MIFKIADFLSPDLYLMEYINIFQLMRPKTWWSQNRTVLVKNSKTDPAPDPA